VEAIREIVTPHHAPHAWTLIVLVAVIVIKWILARRVTSVAEETGSRAVEADALHHHSDLITSAAAFVGISIAVIGGPGWEQADDWAALVASVVIAYNGVKMLRPAIDELMDRTPEDDIVRRVANAATSVEDVCAIEKLKIRKIGVNYAVDIHVQADPHMSLHDAHIVSGKVKTAIRTAMPAVDGVHIHMEPFES
jgi:cation diffusion facilitator family transporter